MDLIMAIQKLKVDSNSIHDIAFFWVKGHPDKDHPVHKISKEQQINVQCDANANECVAANVEDTEFTPLLGTRAMVLRLGKKWVTSRYHDQIWEAHTAEDLHKYATKRVSITRSTYVI